MEVSEQDPEEWIENQKRKRFKEFREREVTGKHCEGCQFTPNPFIKRGSLEADLMLVGEFPIDVDDETGQPFTGDYGKLLTEMLNAIDLNPDRDCYMTNALLCGGSDTDVQQPSINACYENLRRQLKLISPEVVLGMGRYAYSSLYNRSLDEDAPDPWGFQGSLPDFPWIRGVITVNPIHVLHAESGSPRERKIKKLCWEHLKTVAEHLGEESTWDKEEKDTQPNTEGS